MGNKYRFTRTLISLLIVMVWVALAVPAAAAEGPQTHVIRWGDTLHSIARMYAVTVADLAKINKLPNPNTIYVGQRLLIPEIAPGTVVHVVAKGETLLAIAAKYKLSWWDIALRNSLYSPHLVYVGQRLIISQAITESPHNNSTSTAPSTQEEILITQPTADGEVISPLTVKGWGKGLENSLAVDILDASGHTIGQGFADIEAESGSYGPFTGVITFTAPSTAQLGRVQIYSIAARDGAIEHLASVTVKLKP